MQDRHTNLKRYFEEQAITTGKFVIPYIQQVKEITPNTRVLEIGCGTGGNLLPFVYMGLGVTGGGLFFFVAPATTESYTSLFVGSVRCG